MSDYELDRDAELEPDEEQALAALLAPPELAGEQCDTLSGRIARACEMPLARRRREARPRRALAMKWLRPVLPLAAAAALLLMLTPQLSRLRTPEGPGAELTAAERALLADVSEAEFTQLVSGAADAEALLLMAVVED